MARILIIDDDAEFRTMLRQRLERAGCDVVEAPDGRVGIRLFRQEPAHLVITDIVMPEKNGLEIIMALRHEFPCVKIIAISGGGRIGPRGYLHMAGVLGAAPCLLQAFRLEENVKCRPEAYRRGKRMQVDLNRESECIPRLDLLALPGSSKMFGG